MSTPLTDELREIVDAFARCAYPVSTDIDARGHRWSDAYLDELLPRARAILSTQSTNTAGPEPLTREDVVTLIYDSLLTDGRLSRRDAEHIADRLIEAGAPIAPATAGPEPQCRPTWTECQRCKNDFAKCDGVFGAPIAQPPASPTDGNQTERAGKSPEAADEGRAKAEALERLGSVIDWLESGQLLGPLRGLRLEDFKALRAAVRENL